MKKSYALKGDESTGKPGEQSKYKNGNQSCIVFKNDLFLSRSKINFQAVRVGSTMMALIETVAPRPKVIQNGHPLEWI